jgi:hypothetical protein
MHAAEVEVAFGWDVSDVRCYSPLLAEREDLTWSFRVVHRGQDHVDAIEVGGFEFAVDIIDLPLFYPVGDFLVEAFARGYEGDFGVGIEHVHDATSGNLDFCQPSIHAGAFRDRSYLAAADD